MQEAPLVVVPLAHKAAYLDRYAQPDKPRQALAGPGRGTLAGQAG
jgi:hypothetical protein